MKRAIFSRSAFTVIELLVIVSIIAVIAGLLFPALSQARGHSQITVCTSNLRQIGQAIALYTADWDGGLPFAPDPLSKKFSGDIPISSDPILFLEAVIPYDIRALLRSYGCDFQLYHCPLDQIFLRDSGEKPTFFEECGSSYWYDEAHALTGFKLQSYPNPTTNVIMSDYDFFHLGRSTNIDNRTKGTTSLLFADFHVKSHSWTDRSEFLDQVP